MKKSIYLVIMLVCFLTLTRVVLGNTPTPRYAECDVCGYCKGKTVPSNWASCAKCVYPHIVSPGGAGGQIINPDANQNVTLRIETDSSKKNFNRPPEPLSGRMYTQLGCFGGNLNSLADAEAGGELVNFILRNLIFPAVGTVGFIAIIYGGFILATAQGDIYKIQQGRRVIGSSLVGLVFTFSVVLIINTIGSDILQIPGTNQGGDKIVIRASATCFNKAPERGKTPCPNVEAQIKDIGDKIIARYNLGELSLDEKEYVFWTGISFNESSHKLHIYFKDDDYIANVGDKNAYIKSVVLDKEGVDTSSTCKNFSYMNISPAPPFTMAWGGTIENPYSNPAICTEWE